MARDVARRLSFYLRAGCLLAAGAAVGDVAAACYSGGGGTAPPPNTFYFPVGLVVSTGGHVLYAANSDFDLQWNGGTLQSYDLTSVRRDAAALIQANILSSQPGFDAATGNMGNEWLEWLASNGGPFGPSNDADGGRPPTFVPYLGGCLAAPSPDSGLAANVILNPMIINPTLGTGSRVPLGESCAPPVDSTRYIQDSAVIGAFATDLQVQTIVSTGTGPTRLYAPVRGDDTLTWADVTFDSPDSLPQTRGADGLLPPGSPFAMGCGQTAGDLTCDAEHHAGNNPNQLDDTRGATLPGEPFGMAQTEDGTAIAVTHQTASNTSLLLSGFAPVSTASVSAAVGPDGGLVANSTTGAPFAGQVAQPVVMEFVLDGVPNGGNGIAAIPHDPDAPVPPCAPGGLAFTPCVRPAFLETNHTTAEIDLLRYYSDDGSSLTRPYLEREAFYNLTVNQIGSDSRGIVIDRSPRVECKLRAGATASQAALQTCATMPARVFFANRSPPTLVVGEVGETSLNGDGSFDPDLLKINTSVPVLAGPARVYVAPIIDLTGRLALRVFVVNFDSSTIQVFDPSDPNLALVDTLYVGPGPFAMAFDPFTLEDVAASSLNIPAGVVVPELTVDPNGGSPNLTRYRFGYVASFTNSYVQMIDLDRRQPTFESVVYNLGNPTAPKGSGS